MNNENVMFVLIALFCVYALFYLLQKFLELSTGIVKSRITQVYQGGEHIHSKDRRYAGAFTQTIFFMILHVIGFLFATIYTLNKYNFETINPITVGYSLIVFYVILITKRSVI